MKRINEISEIDKVRGEIEKCIGCGNCLYYCPVYAEENNENYVARGRNRLLKEYLDCPEELDHGIKDRFDKCLLCGRCTSVCPQGVRNDLIVMAVRWEKIKHNGLALPKSLTFRKILKNRRLMGKALRAGSRLQWMLPKTREKNGVIQHLPSENGNKIRHLPMFFAGLRGKGQLPTIADRFLSEQVPISNCPAESPKKKTLKVAYFSGCAAEFILPNTGKALIRLLNQLGVEVIFPKEQGCCGIAVYANGDYETAREMALHNLNLFNGLDVDYIVTGCATCGSALKDGWINLAKNDDERNSFEQFARRVRDISELLVQLAEFKPLRFRSLLPENTRVTYHDPCHLANYQGITKQPRSILTQVFGGNFVDMDNNGCCGCGGSFNIYNYKMSSKIGQNKINSIERTYANVVINTCPGCMIQLIDGIEKCKLPQKVVHIVEAIEPMR